MYLKFSSTLNCLHLNITRCDDQIDIKVDDLWTPQNHIVESVFDKYYNLLLNQLNYILLIALIDQIQFSQLLSRRLSIEFCE